MHLGHGPSACRLGSGLGSGLGSLLPGSRVPGCLPLLGPACLSDSSVRLSREAVMVQKAPGQCTTVCGAAGSHVPWRVWSSGLTGQSPGPWSAPQHPARPRSGTTVPVPPPVKRTPGRHSRRGQRGRYLAILSVQDMVTSCSPSRTPSHVCTSGPRTGTVPSPDSIFVRRCPRDFLAGYLLLLTRGRELRETRGMGTRWGGHRVVTVGLRGEGKKRGAHWEAAPVTPVPPPMFRMRKQLWR